MRLILVSLTAALLASCNGMAVTNNGSGNAAATNAAAPANSSAPATPGNMVLPGDEGDAGGNSAAAGDRNSREALLADCTQEAGGALPPGTDAAALCSCAVDRHLAGATQRSTRRAVNSGDNCATSTTLSRRPRSPLNT